MTADIALVYGLIVLALVLFSIERIRIDLTAMLLMAVLMVIGVLDPPTALAGFSNVATVTVAAMFVLSAGLRTTGALEVVGRIFATIARRDERLARTTMLLTVGLVSAFINNTAVVAIFIPIVLDLASDLGWSPSRLLMPLSFASMFGGVCTLIGTSTNLLVSALAVQQGLEPFSMFEFAPLGVILFIVGFAYLLTVGARLVPERRRGRDLAETYEMDPYIIDVVLGPGAHCLGEAVGDNALIRDHDLDILDVYREDDPRPALEGERRLRAGDVLRVRAGAEVIAELLRREGIQASAVGPVQEATLETERDVLVEAVVAAETRLVGQRIGDIDFPHRYGTQVLAVRRGPEIRQDQLPDIRLSGGMSILMRTDRNRLDEIQRAEPFIVVSEPIVPRAERMPIAVLTIIAVVALAALDVLPIVVSAIAGCVVLVLTGTLTLEDAYEAINWKIIFLLAGVLALGFAMEETGAAAQLADAVVGNVAAYGPTAMVAGFFGLALALTAVISNNATAVLLGPIAISTAAQLGLSARPFLMAITFAASLSFVTPIGYQTNTLVYGPGKYRFSDFAKVGAPLNLLCWIVAAVLIPRIYPF